MKRSTLILVLTTLTLFANEPVVPADGAHAVKTAPVKSTNRVYLGSFLANGWLPASEIYRIDAPVEGVIKRLDAKLYEPVKKGQVLAVIKSPKLLELESTYIDTLIEKEYYASEVKRLKPLYQAAVVAKKRFFEAQNTLAKFATQSTFYYHLLMEWGLSKRQVDTITRQKKPIPEIRIYAPVGGKVADLNIYPRMYADRGEHMMTVMNPKKAHYQVALPLKLARLLKPGADLFVGETPAKVESIAPDVDSRTQTVAVHLLPLSGLAILPGEKRNIKLYWPKKAYALPSSAVIDYEDKPAVFVRVAEGFQLRFVRVLGRSSDTVYVTADSLGAGAQIATAGVIGLKGALEAQGDD
ncbi:MAG: HlyD family efflux transporter periplasmic adaptor subunit [Epsilonproteobacteria bacterium]|nr:HlyD family efflux transporter periplasmic adaptor subunit [Campylobacterota bacterium]